MLSISDTDLVRWLGDFFWPFLRTLALFAAAPGFSSMAVPTRVKVALAFVVAAILAPVIQHSAPLTLSWAAVVLVTSKLPSGSPSVLRCS